MKAKIFFCLWFLLILGFLSAGCAPVRDVAGKVSDDFGEVTDELGKERKIGSGEDVIVVEPMADKKIRMKF